MESARSYRNYVVLYHFVYVLTVETYIPPCFLWNSWSCTFVVDGSTTTAVLQRWTLSQGNLTGRMVMYNLTCLFTGTITPAFSKKFDADLGPTLTELASELVQKYSLKPTR